MNRRLLPATLVLLLLTAPAAAAADPPTLGGRISPTHLVYERQSEVNVTNLSSVRVMAILTADGEGWTFDEDRLSLEPGERVTVPLLSAGEAETILRATLTPADLPPGVDAASLTLEVNARHLSPWEQIPSGLWLLFASAALVASWAVLRRLGRHRAD